MSGAPELKFPTRTVAECEELVVLWDAGERDQVRAEFGGRDPSAHFLATFRPRKPHRASPSLTEPHRAKARQTITYRAPPKRTKRRD